MHPLFAWPLVALPLPEVGDCLSHPSSAQFRGACFPPFFWVDTERRDILLEMLQPVRILPFAIALALDHASQHQAFRQPIVTHTHCGEPQKQNPLARSGLDAMPQRALM